MKPVIVKDMLSEEDIERLNDHFDNAPEDFVEYSEGHIMLGRRSVRPGDTDSPQNIYDIAEKAGWYGLEMRGWNIVEYSAEHGEPNLPPHYDRDQTALIINYQLKSNTSWGVGVDEEVFYIEDNTAVLFNPNEHVHWRPKKEFKPGEYVRMIFFRLQDLNNPKDYSHLSNHPSDNVFDKINEIRNRAV